MKGVAGTDAIFVLACCRGTAEEAQLNCLHSVGSRLAPGCVLTYCSHKTCLGEPSNNSKRCDSGQRTAQICAGNRGLGVVPAWFARGSRMVFVPEPLRCAEKLLAALSSLNETITKPGYQSFPRAVTQPPCRIGFLALASVS